MSRADGGSAAAGEGCSRRRWPCWSSRPLERRPRVVLWRGSEEQAGAGGRRRRLRHRRPRPCALPLLRPSRCTAATRFALRYRIDGAGRRRLDGDARRRWRRTAAGQGATPGRAARRRRAPRASSSTPLFRPAATPTSSICATPPGARRRRQRRRSCRAPPASAGLSRSEGHCEGARLGRGAQRQGRRGASSIPMAS